jgi:hypothetical protein
VLRLLASVNTRIQANLNVNYVYGNGRPGVMVRLNLKNVLLLAVPHIRLLE